MRYKCAFSGSGGQGAALMAKLTCLAAIREGLQVVMTQTYGIEQRGGDSTGFVIISDQPIGNPLVESDADVAVALSQSMYGQTLSDARSGGRLFYNSSLVEDAPARVGVERVALPVTEMAQEAGDVRCANIIMLGALIARTGMLGEDSVAGAIAESLGKKNPALLELNLAALKQGLAAGKGAQS